jgi:hypothetical protein
MLLYEPTSCTKKIKLMEKSGLRLEGTTRRASFPSLSFFGGKQRDGEHFFLQRSAFRRSRYCRLDLGSFFQSES